MTAILLGRWLAFCVHPSLAWPRLGKTGRALLVLSYFLGGYLGVLAGLVFGK